MSVICMSLACSCETGEAESAANMLSSYFVLKLMDGCIGLISGRECFPHTVMQSARCLLQKMT